MSTQERERTRNFTSELASERASDGGTEETWEETIQSWCNATLAFQLPYQCGYLDASKYFHGIAWRICVFSTVCRRDRTPIHMWHSHFSFYLCTSIVANIYDCVHSHSYSCTRTRAFFFSFILFIVYLLPSVPYTYVFVYIHFMIPEIKKISCWERDKNG